MKKDKKPSGIGKKPLGIGSKVRVRDGEDTGTLAGKVGVIVKAGPVDDWRVAVEGHGGTMSFLPSELEVID